MIDSDASQKAYAFAVPAINLLNAGVNNKVERNSNLIDKTDDLT